MTIHLMIMQDRQTIADLPEWDGPIPNVGDYIFHPPTDNGDLPYAISGCVKLRTFHLYERGPGKFVPIARPYVEIDI